jgi:hypothetical protein
VQNLGNRQQELVFAFIEGFHLAAGGEVGQILFGYRFCSARYC